MNPTVYASCVKQFWTTAKVKKVNGQEQIQALVDKHKLIITEKSIRRDLKFDDAEGTACLPNDTIFEELARMGAKTTAWNEFGNIMAYVIICLANNQKFNFTKYIFDNMVKHLEGGVEFLMFPRILQVVLDKQVEGMAKHKKIYVISSHTKKVFANMRRQGQGFSRNVTPLFKSMMVNAQEEVGEGLGLHTESHHTPTDTQPSSSKPQEKIKPKRKQSGEYSIQLNELMIFCTYLQQQVLDLEEAKTAQAKEIANLKKRVKKLEKWRKSRPAGLRRLKKVGSSKQVESSEEKDILSAQEEASKKGRSIEDIDQDAEITLVDEAQGRMYDVDMFGVDNLEVTAASVEDSAAPTTTTIVDVDELTLAKTLNGIKAAKPKVISTAATLVTTDITTLRAKGIVFHEQVQAHIPTVSSSKDKGKAKMIEPEKPLKKKDQIALDEEVARKLKAEMKAEMEKEEMIAREKDEANRVVIEKWDDVHATIDVDRQLAEQIQAQEREQLSIEERSKLLAELIESRRKYFTAKRAEEIRNKPPTKAQQKNLMCTYMKNIKGFKQKDFKGKSFNDIKKMFDKVYKRVNTFVDMNTENVKESLKKTQAEVTEGSSKRAGQELEQESAKKQKLDEQEQAKVVDDDTAELKRCLKIVSEDDDVSIEATPLSSKSPTINFNREDLEVLRSIVMERFKKTKPVDDMDNLLFQTLKTIFEPHFKDITWKYQQGAVKVNNWKLFDSCRVYCVTTKNMVYYLLVKKMYPFTNSTSIVVRVNAAYAQLVLLVYKVTAVFNKVNAAKSRVTTVVRVSTAGWIKWLKDQDISSSRIKISYKIDKDQVAQKKVKIDFENADLSSRVELIPSKIKYANKVILNFHREFSVFSSLTRKGNDGLLLDQVFKNKEEVVIRDT
nr:hypothetical protein [Tanacetum cinerariifolium]